MKFVKVLSCTLLLIISSSAFSADWSGSVKITKVIVDYMPDMLRFNVDTSLGNCSAGTWLDHKGKGSDQATKRENLKVVYSATLAALMSGTTVWVNGINAGCEIDNMQFSNVR